MGRIRARFHAPEYHCDCRRRRARRRAFGCVRFLARRPDRSAGAGGGRHLRQARHRARRNPRHAGDRRARRLAARGVDGCEPADIDAMRQRRLRHQRRSRRSPSSAPTARRCAPISACRSASASCSPPSRSPAPTVLRSTSFSCERPADGAAAPQGWRRSERNCRAGAGGVVPAAGVRPKAVRSTPTRISSPPAARVIGERRRAQPGRRRRRVRGRERNPTRFGFHVEIATRAQPVLAGHAELQWLGLFATRRSSC